MQAEDRGLTTVLTMTFHPAKQFEADRARAVANLTTLVDRAKAAGKLRADFVTEDIPIFLLANAATATTANAAPDTWRRPDNHDERAAPQDVHEEATGAAMEG